MTAERAEPSDARRESLLQAAIGVFLRYGYKKTSMDDLARAADLSRQGLYLHFATKEALFKEAVIQLSRQSRVTMRAALKREDLTIEERLLGAFVAFKSHAGGEMPREHLDELLLTATQLVGPVIEELEQTVIADVTQVPAIERRCGGMESRRADGQGTCAALCMRHPTASSIKCKRSPNTKTACVSPSVSFAARQPAQTHLPSRGARKP